MKGKKLLGVGALAGTAVAAAVISRRNKNGSITINTPVPAADDFNVSEVTDEFLKIAEIPRKSGYEERVGDYLIKWAGDCGLICVRDKNGNVIIDKPASRGYETHGRVILQAHMDMVCAAKDDKDYDFLKNGIQTVLDVQSGTLTADGTSLGADDGIGVAEILYILKKRNLKHPPLRAIFTVCEETGMDGAIGLSDTYLDAKYLINIDNEDIDSLCNSCADSASHILTKPFTAREPIGDCAFEISVSGLSGGHSGTDINLGRANAAQILGAALKEAINRGISVELSALSGGEAGNAIPKSANAAIITNSEKAASFKNCLNSVFSIIKHEYRHSEPNMKLELTELSSVPTPVAPAEAAVAVADLISVLPCGVNSMSPLIDGLVESSANIGVIGMKDGKIELIITTRSSTEGKSQKLSLAVKTAARLAGFEYDKAAYSPGWELNPNNALAEKYAKAFKAVTGRNIKSAPIHAGLECGCFARKNPKLDMISIGPTIHNIHTPNETLILKTVTENTKAIIKTLENL